MGIIMFKKNREYYHEKGVLKLEKGEFLKAAKSLSKAIKCHSLLNVSKNRELEALDYNARGLAYSNLQQYNNAIADFTYAIRYNPNCLKAYYYRGLAYGGIKEYSKGINDMSECIRRNPDDANALISRCRYYFLNKEKDKAIDDASSVIRIAPMADAYMIRATSYGLDKKYNEALTDFILGNKLFTTEPMFCDGAAEMLMFLGRNGEAVKWLEQAVKLKSNSCATYYYLGCHYFKLFKFEIAIENFEKAISIDPNFANALGKLGCCYSCLCDWEKAEHYLQKALKINPQLQNYANAHETIKAQREKEKCLKAYQQVYGEGVEPCRVNPKIPCEIGSPSNSSGGCDGAWCGPWSEYVKRFSDY